MKKTVSHKFNLILATLSGLVSFISIFIYFIIHHSSGFDEQCFNELSKLIKDIHSNSFYGLKTKTILLLEIVDDFHKFHYTKKLKHSKHNKKLFDLLQNKTFITNMIPLTKQERATHRTTSFSDNSLARLNSVKSFSSIEKEILQISKQIHWYFDILEWPAVEIANQLTLQTFEIVKNLKSSEFLNANWTKKKKETTSPNILKMIDRFNKLFYWIIDEILSYDKKSIRCKVIEKFICVALFLKELKNFNDLVLIVSVLNSNIIKKLEKTLKMTGNVYKKHWIELTELCSPEKNYINLRKCQYPDSDETIFNIADNYSNANILDQSIVTHKKTVTTNYSLYNDKSRKNSFGSLTETYPTIPYLGLLLRDISFCLEGGSYTKDEHYINVDLIYLQSNLIYNYMKHKYMKYDFSEDSNLAFLLNTIPLSEEELYRKLELLEPKFKLYDDKSIDKRPSNTDKHYFVTFASNNDIEYSQYDSEIRIVERFF